MRRFGCLLLLLMGCILVRAQFYIGLRDSKYAVAGYQWDSGWQVQLDQSIFETNLRSQYIRGGGGFQFYHNRYFDFMASAFAGTTYCNNFYDFGARIDGSYLPLKWLELDAGINPRYDSDYGYETTYLVGLKFHINDEIALLSQYSTIPEYRISEKRARLGLEFKVKNLAVAPMISVPVKGNTLNLRILVGLKYEFITQRYLNRKNSN